MAMEPGSDRDNPQDNAPSSVRRVRSDGPQHVIVHGHHEVVVIAAEDYRRLQGAQTGEALVAALQQCRYLRRDPVRR